MLLLSGSKAQNSKKSEEELHTYLKHLLGGRLDYTFEYSIAPGIPSATIRGGNTVWSRRTFGLGKGATRTGYLRFLLLATVVMMAGDF